MSQVIFGVDEGKKAIAICYKQGCLQLCMKLVESAHVVYPLNTRTTKIDTDSVAESPKLTNEQDAVWRGALKLIKCSVIRCNVGRTRCRTAGVFDFFQALLVTFLPAPTTDRNVALLMEECMTTLAAVCLGNDLNALQVCCDGSVCMRSWRTKCRTHTFYSSLRPRFSCNHMSHKLRRGIHKKTLEVCIKRFTTSLHCLTLSKRMKQPCWHVLISIHSFPKLHRPNNYCGKEKQVYWEDNTKRHLSNTRRHSKPSRLP